MLSERQGLNHLAFLVINRKITFTALKLEV